MFDFLSMSLLNKTHNSRGKCPSNNKNLLTLLVTACAGVCERANEHSMTAVDHWQTIANHSTKNTEFPVLTNRHTDRPMEKFQRNGFIEERTTCCSYGSFCRVQFRILVLSIRRRRWRQHQCLALIRSTLTIFYFHFCLHILGDFLRHIFLFYSFVSFA